MRIVSLLPSATEIICALGLEDQLVGVTHECDYPATVAGLPKVTRTLIPHNASSRDIDRLVRDRLKTERALYSLDMPTLERLRPDLIVTQALCDVCAVAEAEVTAAACSLPGQPRVVNLEPMSLGEVFDCVRLVGEAAGVTDWAADVVRGLQARVDAVAKRTETIADQPAGVILEWIDPPFGCGHWSPELVRLAGGREVIGREGQPSQSTTWDAIRAADPEWLLVACCGFDTARNATGHADFGGLSWLQRIAMRSVRTGVRDRRKCLLQPTRPATGRQPGTPSPRPPPGRSSTPVRPDPSDPMASAKRVVVSWSTGKDCAWALHLLRQDPDIEVVGLLTTFNEAADRVAMHSVRRELVDAQAAVAGLPLVLVPLPWPCPNAVYESGMKTAIARCGDDGVTHIAYGDLFLDDIRGYRERLLKGTSVEPLFPVWGRREGTLDRAKTMLEAGVEAVITTVDTSQLAASYCGRIWNAELVADLPAGVDPCGERGEFHTFCTAGPMFTAPIRLTTATPEVRERFAFAELTASV